MGAKGLNHLQTECDIPKTIDLLRSFDPKTISQVTEQP